MQVFNNTDRALNVVAQNGQAASPHVIEAGASANIPNAAIVRISDADAGEGTQDPNAPEAA